MAVGVNILQDCTVTATFSAADLGGGEVFSGSQSFKVDKISLKETESTADHSTAQDAVEFHRSNKGSWQCDIETKLHAPALLAAIRNNSLMTIIVTAPNGLGFTAVGLITGRDFEYAGPSTMKWTLMPRGVRPTFA